MQTEPRTGKVRSAGAGKGQKTKKWEHLPATAPATPHGLKKGGKVPDVKKDAPDKRGKTATPLAPRDRKGFMNSIFPGKDMGKGTRVKKGFAEGGAVEIVGKAAQPASVPSPATATPAPVKSAVDPGFAANKKPAAPSAPAKPSPAAPSPTPPALQVQAQERSRGKGIMSKLFPKMHRRGFMEGGYVEGGPVDDPAAEPGETMATAPESSNEEISGAAPVENAAAEAFPQQDKGELPAEVPGDGSDKVTTEGTFSAYLKEGVDPQLVEKGNALEKRLGESAGDDATMTQFMADAKDYIDELKTAVKTAQGQGGGEMLRGLKAMLKDAEDLMAAHDTMMAESGSADQAVQNAPDIVMQASRKSEAA